MAFREVNTAAILQLDKFTVASAPDATKNTGGIIYVTDGNAGAPTIAVSNGVNWLRMAPGAAIAII